MLLVSPVCIEFRTSAHHSSNSLLRRKTRDRDTDERQSARARVEQRNPGTRPRPPDPGVGHVAGKVARYRRVPTSVPACRWQGGSRSSTGGHQMASDLASAGASSQRRARGHKRCTHAWCFAVSLVPLRTSAGEKGAASGYLVRWIMQSRSSAIAARYPRTDGEMQVETGLGQGAPHRANSRGGTYRRAYWSSAPHPPWELHAQATCGDCVKIVTGARAPGDRESVKRCSAGSSAPLNCSLDSRGARGCPLLVGARLCACYRRTCERSAGQSLRTYVRACHLRTRGVGGCVCYCGCRHHLSVRSVLLLLYTAGS